MRKGKGKAEGRAEGVIGRVSIGLEGGERESLMITIIFPNVNRAYVEAAKAGLSNWASVEFQSKVRLMSNGGGSLSSVERLH